VGGRAGAGYGTDLRAINAVDISPAFNMELAMGAVAKPIDASAIDTAYREAVTAVFDSVHPESGWRLQFFSGEPGPVLVAESSAAALLVVGTKEHAGVTLLISGSVSHYCLSHAPCPIVAVPAEPDHGIGRDRS
jgi:nucleotide-binding universal stress UspA family protein